MPTGQTFQMAKWLPPQLQLSSAATASESGLLVLGVLARSRKVHRGKTSESGTTWGILSPVLSTLELSDSQHKSKTGGESSSMEPWCMGLDPTDVAHRKMVDQLSCLGGVGWLMEREFF